MIKKLLFCTDNGQYFKEGDNWHTRPTFTFVKQPVKAARYSFSKADADTIKFVIDCAFAIGLTFVVKQFEITTTVVVKEVV